MVTVKTATNTQLLTAYHKLEQMDISEGLSEKDEQLFDLLAEELFCRGLGI